MDFIVLTIAILDPDCPLPSLLVVSTYWSVAKILLIIFASPFQIIQEIYFWGSR
jgi:hypothetical protein